MLLNICPGCLCRTDNTGLCPVCKKRVDSWHNAAHQLKIHSLLNSKYLIGSVLSESKTAIYYRAYDIEDCKPVTVSEYFPKSAAVRNVCGSISGMFGCFHTDDFRNRTEAITKLKAVPEPIRIRDLFEANHTVYIIHDAFHAVSLEEWLDLRGGTIDFREAVCLLSAAVRFADSICKEAGLCCGSISSCDIFVTVDKLVFFAGWYFYDGHTRDDAAMASVFYRCITGILPSSSEPLSPSCCGSVLPARAESVLMRYITDAAPVSSLSAFYRELTSDIAEFSPISYPSGAIHFDDPQPALKPLTGTLHAAELSSIIDIDNSTPHVEELSTSAEENVSESSCISLSARDESSRRKKCRWNGPLTAAAWIILIVVGTFFLRRFSLSALQDYSANLLSYTDPQSIMSIEDGLLEAEISPAGNNLLPDPSQASLTDPNGILCCSCLVSPPDGHSVFYSGNHFEMYMENSDGIFCLENGQPVTYLNVTDESLYYITPFENLFSITRASDCGQKKQVIMSSDSSLTCLNYYDGMLYFLRDGAAISSVDSCGDNVTDIFSAADLSLLSIRSGKLFWISDHSLYSMSLVDRNAQVFFDQEDIYFYQFVDNDLLCACSDYILRLSPDGEITGRYDIDTYYFCINNESLYYSDKSGNILVTDITSGASEIILSGLGSEALDICFGEYQGADVLWFFISEDGLSATSYAAIKGDSGWISVPIRELLMNI